MSGDGLIWELTLYLSGSGLILGLILYLSSDGLIPELILLSGFIWVNFPVRSNPGFMIKLYMMLSIQLWG